MLKKLSLIKQLLLVFGILAILDVAVLMPLVDYNMHHIIDEQMYTQLEQVQDNTDYIEGTKKVRRGKAMSIYYNVDTSTFISYNFPGPVDIAESLSSYLYGDDLKAIIKDSKHTTIKNKGEFNDQSYYYRISKYSDSLYMITLISSDYSDELLESMQQRIIYIQYGFLGLSALVLALWGLTLISPLRKIKNYVDGIKMHKEMSLNVNRGDEIGVVADAIVAMKEDIEKQEKAKEEMIHNISHDLKTPIALIKTYGESVKDDIYPYGSKEASMDIILENADRLERKVKALLYLNRLDYIGSEEKTLTPFNMKELLEHTVNQMNMMNDIQIVTDLEEVSFLGNSDHWRVAIENIIENAFRYAKSTIKITLRKNELSIFNDGDPIEEDRIEDLFSPYVKGVKGQFGLGLSIVSKTAEMYGYDIKARNENNGVNFVFTKQDK